ncbi:MAG: toxin-antitoxin system TumE family protein [Steroidobacteraceae bacterium]
MSNIQSRLLVDQRVILESERKFVEIVIWEVPMPVHGSGHGLKYRLALIVDGECALRYDNEAGKDGRRHADGADLSLLEHREVDGRFRAGHCEGAR